MIIIKTKVANLSTKSIQEKSNPLKPLSYDFLLVYDTAMNIVLQKSIPIDSLVSMRNNTYKNH